MNGVIGVINEHCADRGHETVFDESEESQKGQGSHEWGRIWPALALGGVCTAASDEHRRDLTKFLVSGIQEHPITVCGCSVYPPALLGIWMERQEIKLLFFGSQHSKDKVWASSGAAACRPSDAEPHDSTSDEDS